MTEVVLTDVQHGILIGLLAGVGVLVALVGALLFVQIGSSGD